MPESGTEKNGNSNRPASELDSPVWSVISFERCEESGLSYWQAVQKMDQLLAENVSGLCIVTDAAAAQIHT